MSARRRLTITRTWQIAEGAKNDHRWTLSGVEANDEAGNPIVQTLKTFDALIVGTTVEVQIERQSSDKFGDEYLLRAAS
jgi:hypothetical protein